MSRDFCRRLVPPVFLVLVAVLATAALAERPAALPGTVVDSVTGQAWQQEAPGVQTLDLEGKTQTRFTGVEGLETMRDHLEERLVTILELHLANPSERSARALGQHVDFLRSVEDAIAEAAANPGVEPRAPEKANCSSNFAANTGPAPFPGCGNTASASAFYNCRQDCEVMTEVILAISTCGGSYPFDFDSCTDSTFPYSCSNSITLYDQSPEVCDGLAESYLICPGTGPYGLLMASDYTGNCNCYAC